MASNLVVMASTDVSTNNHVSYVKDLKNAILEHPIIVSGWDWGSRCALGLQAWLLPGRGSGYIRVCVLMEPQRSQRNTRKPLRPPGPQIWNPDATRTKGPRMLGVGPSSSGRSGPSGLFSRSVWEDHLNVDNLADPENGRPPTSEPLLFARGGGEGPSMSPSLSCAQMDANASGLS